MGHNSESAVVWISGNRFYDCRSLDVRWIGHVLCVVRDGIGNSSGELRWDYLTSRRSLDGASGEESDRCGV